jgi:predicted transposase YbfD/YdcC
LTPSYWNNFSDLWSRNLNIKKIFGHIGELKTNCTEHLDVGFSEDASRKRNKNATQNYSVLLKIVLNLLKNEKTEKKRIAGK